MSSSIEDVKAEVFHLNVPEGTDMEGTVPAMSSKRNVCSLYREGYIEPVVIDDAFTAGYSASFEIG